MLACHLFGKLVAGTVWLMVKRTGAVQPTIRLNFLPVACRPGKIESRCCVSGTRPAAVRRSTHGESCFRYSWFPGSQPTMSTRSARNRIRRCRLTCMLETLESRQMLAASPIITEFMADNDDVLQDGYGDLSDWIEISNLGDASLDLAGWHLTDDPADLTKWTFPSRNLDVGRVSGRLRVE